MAQNKIMGFGPVAMASSATNILNPAVTSMSGPVGVTIGQPYFIVTRIRIVEKAGTGGTFQLFIGATGGSAAGTEFLGKNTLIPPGGAFEWYGRKRLDSTQFLSGLASAATTLTIEGDVEIGIS